MRDGGLIPCSPSYSPSLRLYIVRTASPKTKACLSSGSFAISITYTSLLDICLIASARRHSWFLIFARLANISSFLVALLTILLNFLQLSTEISLEVRAWPFDCGCDFCESSSTFSRNPCQVVIQPFPKSGSVSSMILLIIASIVCWGSSISANSISRLSLSSSYEYLNLKSWPSRIYSSTSALGIYVLCFADKSLEYGIKYFPCRNGSVFRPNSLYSL